MPPEKCRYCGESRRSAMGRKSTKTNWRVEESLYHFSTEWDRAATEDKESNGARAGRMCINPPVGHPLSEGGRVLLHRRLSRG